MRRRRGSILILLALLFAAACADDGRELADPSDWQTTTTRPPPPTSAPPERVSDTGLRIWSPDFEPGADFPVAVQCAGDNLFPSLQWEAVPAGTVELSVTLADQTNPEDPLLLWLAAGIPPSTGALDAGFLPAGGFETLNDYGALGWGTPCLEELGTDRDLQFTIWALGSPAGFAPGAPGNEAWDDVAARAIDSATVLMRVP